jgi:hypothetical protein
MCANNVKMPLQICGNKNRVDAKMNKQKSLRVFIIEEHTECLECLSIAARRGIINLHQCDLVHFDSHPDLSCPETIEYGHISNRIELCHLLRNSESGISTFILPSIAIGLIRNMVWIKPSWSQQIPNGVYPGMTFGWRKDDDSITGNPPTSHMCMHTDLPYWVDDGVAVSHLDALDHRFTFDLTISHVDDWNMDTNSSSDWILDVCLDYFSCSNPLNEPFLPDHESTPDEIEELLSSFRNTLQSLSHKPPKCCVIARSEMDGFTPSDVALNLQASVLAVIEHAFGAIKILHVQSHENFYDPAFLRSI